MDIFCEYRIHDVACGEDRCVLVVPKSKSYAVRCVNYRSPDFGLSLRKDFSRYTYTLTTGDLSSCLHQFCIEVNYLFRCYGGFDLGL